ncbi:hypothetical protein P152DRAFT_470148 [Eremomyces bilateralis CBS 781.70]|uniref:Xylanolytic transcriptional activator regulatory domain-containing protein n=1 Tax=Eremomyces bilateralis CBS 781.70 TaxID=1392243 RepID=A0A6G1GDB6_9PEZI|nr:uncharacterized protein P152DRAFT_470148 [Eremomyces bilateralis CBS 781.70]KAF1816095.1 hypothetical protein P152DRAFT_470148 [Eremomyces bilateralis CBS 781.70]
MVSHNDSDTLWNFMGFVQRTAMGLSLHRDPEPLEGMSPFEKEMRRRLWATIVFLDLHVAIGSGMPTLIRPQDYSTRPPANIDEDQLSVDMVHTPQGAFPEHTTSTFQTRLAEILPDICAIISNINSAAPDLKYKDVLEFDAKLRQSLKASLACVSSRRNPVIGPKSLDRPHIQSSMLQLFVRGVMLALHCHYFMDPEKHPDYQTSYWAVLDCSLAILGQQRQIYDANSSELPTTWFNDINQGSYFIAAAHVTLGIKHGSFLSGPMALIGSSANETAWMLMDSLASISEEDVGRSVEYFKRYSAFYQRYATLQALVNGGDTEQARNDAFEHIIKVVSEKAAELYPSPFYG